MACALLLAPAIGRADHDPSLVDLADQLADEDPGERIDAVEQLKYRGPAGVLLLIRAVKREGNMEVLIVMLRELGESGAVEALGIIQGHAQSPAKNLRQAGRRALKRWLEVNRVLGEEQELPDPPHPFYGPPPRFSPDRAAGHSLMTRLERPAWLDDEPSKPPPYEPAPRDGAPDGYHFEEAPRTKLVIAGSVVFAGVYFATATGAAVGLSYGPSSEVAVMFIPVVGPFVGGGMLLSHGNLAGALALISGGGQLAGSVLLVVGLTATEMKLMPNAVSLSPSGATLSWTF